MEAFPSCPTREPSGNSEKTFGARGPPQLGEGEPLGLGAGGGVFEVPQQFHCEAELRQPPPHHHHQAALGNAEHTAGEPGLSSFAVLATGQPDTACDCCLAGPGRLE